MITTTQSRTQKHNFALNARELEVTLPPSLCCHQRQHHGNYTHYTPWALLRASPMCPSPSKQTATADQPPTTAVAVRQIDTVTGQPKGTNSQWRALSDTIDRPNWPHTEHKLSLRTHSLELIWSKVGIHLCRHIFMLLSFFFYVIKLLHVQSLPGFHSKSTVATHLHY